jgi:hypothetical protein
MTHIAVLTSNYQDTVQWLMERVGSLIEWNEMNKTITTDDNSIGTHIKKRYYIITSPKDLQGREFDEYQLSPFYETLEDIVKTRIRNGNKGV